MPEIMIIAGPNGAGKTSFAREYFANKADMIYVNADEIARNLDTQDEKPRNFQAGRLMLLKIKQLTKQKASFAIETTLATKGYARKIPQWQRLGYHIVLLYIKLPSVEHSIMRVQHRVKEGGHDILEQDIRRRFPRSLNYLGSLYKPLVNEWYIFDSLEGDFILSETWKDT